MDSDTRSVRTASLVAGVGLALMAVLAAFGVFGSTNRLITSGDAVTTAHDIAESQTLFRLGVASLIVVVVLDIIVASALRTLFTTVRASISTTAAWFRVAYAAVYLVAILQLVLALDLLGDPNQALRAIEAYDTMWLVGLILFGIHLLLVGYLAYRSGFMAKVFGILLAVAGLGYVVDGFVAVLVSGDTPSIAQYTFVGEVALIFWLLIKGRQLTVSHAGGVPGPDTESEASLAGQAD